MRKRVAVAAICALVFSFLNLPIAQAGQVTSGLLIDLNAANPNSYSGTGTAWIDLAGGDDTATLTNGPTFDTATGAGITTDGVNDVININNRTALQLNLTNCSTVSVWAKVLTATANMGIFNKMWGLAYGYDGYALSLSGTNGLTLNMNGTTANDIKPTGSNVYTTGAWTLFTMVTCFNGNTTRPSYIYVNGTLTYTWNNIDSGYTYNNAPIQIAASQNNAGYANLKIGAVAYYDRALTTQEITDNYNYYLNYIYVVEASTLSLSANSIAYKGNSITLTATLGTAGRVRFYFNGKRIAGCLNVATSAYPYIATCTFKPPVGGTQVVSATLTPTNGSFANSSGSKSISVLRRSNAR